MGCLLITDEDFGKDFLNFWGSSEEGKDNLDFDMKEVPRNKKKPFNFDKLCVIYVVTCTNFLAKHYFHAQLGLLH